MLLYGDCRNIQDNCCVYNFCALVEGFQDAGLMPPNSLGALSEYDFDIKYMNYIFNNDMIFMNFMRIILDLYYGNNVYLIISNINDDWCSMITESLMKLIQQRYGINAVEIDSMEDLFYAEDSGFNPYWGVANLDVDKSRYTYLYETARLASGGKIQYE